MRKGILLAAICAVGLIGLPGAVADKSYEDGRYRVYRLNGSYVEGDVKRLPNGDYEVSVGIGTVVLKKHEIRGMVPMSGSEADPVRTPRGRRDRLTSARPVVSKADIEEILSGITAEYDPSLEGHLVEDMMAPLPVNEESLEEMKRLMGPGAEVLLKPHFAMVYTSSEDSARALGARLESVWRANVKFLKLLDVPARLPDYKLEIMYFAEYEGLDAYCNNQANPLSPGVLGFYVPDWNRSHFYDLATSPWIKQRLAQAENKDVPWEERQYNKNVANAWVEFSNREVIQHETGHHIHFNIGMFPRDAFGGQKVPIWMVEGTTMLFEVPPSRAGASLGVMNHNRLHELRKKFGEHPLDEETWKAFLFDNRMWHGAGWSTYDSYQLGWSMVYFLFKERREQYGEYLRAIYGREEEVDVNQRAAEFEGIFGPVSEWIDDYYAFLDSLALRPSLTAPDLQKSYSQHKAEVESGRRGGGGSDRDRGRGGSGRGKGGRGRRG